MEIKYIYWLAGLLDGEGWFGFQATPHFSISQVDLDIVEKAKSIIGNCPPIKFYKSKNPKHSDHYVLTINGDLAISWMMTIYSLMSIRRKSQILKVINQWKQMTGHLGPGQEVSARNSKKGALTRVFARAHNISNKEAKKILDKVLSDTIQ